MKAKNIPSEILEKLEKIRSYYMSHDCYKPDLEEVQQRRRTQEFQEIETLNMELRYRADEDVRELYQSMHKECSLYWIEQYRMKARERHSWDECLKDMERLLDLSKKSFLLKEELTLAEIHEYCDLQNKYIDDLEFHREYGKKQQALIPPSMRKKQRHQTKKAFRLVARKKANSKLGGLPNLPETIPWPCNDNQQAMIFVSQIDFSEVPKIKSDLIYPESGAVLFFYDPEYYMAIDKPFGKTVFIPTIGKSEHAAPESMDKDFFIEQASPIGFKAITSKETSPAEEEISEVPQHMLFGFPALIQDGDMREECVERCGGEVDDWILLLQLDEDADLSMIWGDAGRAYYWIRKQDLSAGIFSNTCLLIQSC